MSVRSSAQVPVLGFLIVLVLLCLLARLGYHLESKVVHYLFKIGTATAAQSREVTCIVELLVRNCAVLCCRLAKLAAVGASAGIRILKLSREAFSTVGEHSFDDFGELLVGHLFVGSHASRELDFRIGQFGFFLRLQALQFVRDQHLDVLLEWLAVFDEDDEHQEQDDVPEDDSEAGKTYHRDVYPHEFFLAFPFGVPREEDEKE